ncbi:MAG: ABC transporter permease [Promethearchaeota archaeon]
MSESDTWMEAISGRRVQEETPTIVNALAIVQMLIGVLAMAADVVQLGFVYGEFAAEDIALVGFLGNLFIVFSPLLFLGFFMIRVGLSIRRMEVGSFTWVIYGNLLIIGFYLLGGSFLPLLGLVHLIPLVLLMTPQVRAHWWELFREDMGPRAKETRYTLYLIRRSPLVVAGIIIIAVYVFMAFAAPYITPYGPTERDWYSTLNPPSAAHPWGTDQNGGDVYSMVIWATQIDLKIAVSVVAVALVFGALIGAAAGYFGGAVDEVVMRITDVFFAFPGLILAMAIVAALGERNLDNISIALMVVWWPTYARLVRGQVLIEREKLYVEAARSVGASDMRILLSHILPNTIQPVIVQATLDMGGVLLTAAGLSFIGFGAEAGTAEWGWMISQGQNHFFDYWVTFYPGMAILLCALAFNLVGDGVRDILDPKLRRR